MKDLTKIPLSVLDLAPIVAGSSAGEALSNAARLARSAESLGYNRFWLAEHHSMPGIASAATAVVIAHVAGQTSRIRVGAGGIMLSNHAPLIVAEQFGTLESLFPGRIDLGLGRAPGSDGLTMRALRRRIDAADDFPEQLQELLYFLKKPVTGQRVTAVPGGGLDIPIWLLGSSDFSARLAGRLGRPFSFAAHFSPDSLIPALEIYRRSFEASEVLDRPYAMVAINIFAAETDAVAEEMATSQFQSFLSLSRGMPTTIQPPVKDMDAVWTEAERAAVRSRLGGSIIGGPEKVAKGLSDLLERTDADEFIIHTMAYDFDERVRSYEIVADVAGVRKQMAGSNSV